MADVSTRQTGLAKQFSRFSLVGIVGTAFHYVVMGFLIEIGGLPTVRASGVGFVTSAIISYALNRKITFATNLAHRKALPRFLAVGAVGMWLNSIAVGALGTHTSRHWLSVQITATLLVLCWNFAANRLWTFD
jgi:putative flippase GtrA